MKAIKSWRPALGTAELCIALAMCRLLAKADLQDCNHCGGHCEWDAESEWQEKWNDWDSKLSYYDRTYAPLMDEW